MGELNIYQKINEVRKEVEYVKRGSAGQGTGVLYDEVVALARDSMVNHGILVTTDFISDNSRLTDPKKSYIYEAFIKVWYVNCDNPSDKFSTDIVAHAMDGGDKAPGKALTYATKASLVKVLLLETGINDESRTAQPVIYAKDQFDFYHDLVTDKNAIGLFCFSRTISEEVNTSLYNSFPDGKKSSGKKEVNELTMRGAKDVQDLVVTLDQMASNEDIAITEEVEGFGDIEKRVIGSLLQPSTVKFIKQCKEAQ